MAWGRKKEEEAHHEEEPLLLGWTWDDLREILSVVSGSRRSRGAQLARGNSGSGCRRRAVPPPCTRAVCPEHTAIQ